MPPVMGWGIDRAVTGVGREPVLLSSQAGAAGVASGLAGGGALSSAAAGAGVLGRPADEPLAGADSHRGPSAAALPTGEGDTLSNGMSPGTWAVGVGGAGAHAVEASGPHTRFDMWRMTKRFAAAMGEAISELADSPEQQLSALRSFFDLYAARLLRPGALDPATAGDLPGFATKWLQQQFRVPGYPSSDEGEAGARDKQPPGPRRGKGSGEGSARVGRKQGRAQGGAASRQRSRSAGAPPVPPAPSGSTCPDPVVGLRRSDRPRRPPDPANMYSSSGAGATT